MIRIDCQQGSPEWFEARLGIPTASNFDRIITPKTGKPSAQRIAYRNALLAEWFLGESADELKQPFMERGTEMEDEAVRWYEFTYDKTVERVGLCLLDDRTAGGSPDGLIGDDGGIEIKCLSAHRHVQAALYEDDDHRCQIQGLLYVTGCNWWDRVYYHPSLPSVVRTYERDEPFIKALTSALDDFHDDFVEKRQELERLGWTRQEPKPRHLCEETLPNGRTCSSGHSVIETPDGWRCLSHSPALAELYG